jgi:hypothetical protein
MDATSLSAAETARLLNSSPLGTVTSAARVRRDIEKAGSRFAPGGKVHLARYVGWLRAERAKAASEAAKYSAHKDRMAKKQRQQSETARDIANGSWVRPPEDPERRERCTKSFLEFCRTYFPETFRIPFSPDHYKAIERIEAAVIRGELFALAMPRGSGKTTLCEIACIWAIITGHRDFVCLIGAEQHSAHEMLSAMRVELENNELLDADFSEITGPIRALEGITQRASGQLFNGQRTAIFWTAEQLSLPTLPPLPWFDDKRPPGAGAIVRVAGITGRVRGMKAKLPDGRSVRPSLVLVDDPQSDESARSPSQCATREAILAGAVLGLAGPGKRIAGLCTVTVVRPDDMADRILDRNRHPEWQGERTKLVYEWPTRMDLWAEYWEMRREGQRAGTGTEAADAFYIEHREDMDAGARVAWEDRKHEEEVSALHHAMNLRCDRGEAAFASEFQNDPLPEHTSDLELMTAAELAAKTNGHPMREIPLTAEHLTAFVDVQQGLLWYVVAAWAPNFSGFVVDYGTWPDQNRAYFVLRDAKDTLQVRFPADGLERQLFAGLEALAADLLTRDYRREDGSSMKVARCLIDANWGLSTETVYQFCRSSPHAQQLVPSHGRYVGAAGNPFSEYPKKPGDKIGVNWRMPALGTKRSIRHVVYDTNFWKSFLLARLKSPLATPGCLSLNSGRDHGMLADHLTAEVPVRVSARNRTIDEWQLLPGRDNHWLDGAVGCCVAASMLGCETTGVERAQQRTRKVFTAADLDAAQARWT